MVKTKQLIREKVWFPGIDKMVEAVVRNCEACQRTVEEKKNLPLVMTQLPDGPWLSLAADFAGPLPGNKDQNAADDWDSTMIEDTSKDQTLESSQSGAMTGNLESASTGQGSKDPTAVEARAPLEEPRRYPIHLNRGQPPQKFGDTVLY
ncbi:uncharacterized protein LOC135384298 [Ornithodoros turicata]|uniref:uncharacterized protein LOC135384298 n=1 Tax=Ornithodoros turicata TaxID=34597 RepID=UPI00313A07B8